VKNDYFQILARSTVRRLLRAGPNFGEFLDRFAVPGGPVRRFPNGGVEIDRSRVQGELAAAFVACTTPGCEIEGASVFRSIGPFSPKRQYY